MCLAIEKKPRWKEREEFLRKSSFDDALEYLGVNKEFRIEKKEKVRKKAIRGD